MTTTENRSDEAAEMGSVRTGDRKLEVVVMPVSDADRAKRFYANLGRRLDAADHVPVVQLKPRGLRGARTGRHRTVVVSGGEVVAIGGSEK